MQRKFIFDGGSSTRYHTATVFNRQSIADHSFGVAWFCELLTDGRASKSLIMAALAHDLAEHQVGDIPSPSKRALGLGKQFDEYEKAELDKVGLDCYTIGEEEKTVLKVADCMEGLMFCLKERRLGNRHVDIIFGRFCEYIRGTLAKAPLNQTRNEWTKKSANMLIQIIDEWEELINDR